MTILAHLLVFLILFLSEAKIHFYMHEQLLYCHTIHHADVTFLQVIVKM